MSDAGFLVMALYGACLGLYGAIRVVFVQPIFPRDWDSYFSDVGLMAFGYALLLGVVKAAERGAVQ